MTRWIRRIHLWWLAREGLIETGDLLAREARLWLDSQKGRTR